MEVHHHPHAEKKSFKEYLLEGLMIFLAVTMGFIAESLREHITENKRAKEYATTMVSDLSSDTADLKIYLRYYKYGTSNIDTLMQLLSAGETKNIPSGKLYWYGLWGGMYRFFVSNDATIHQMKSSGTLRYFSNRSINQKVAKYDQLCRKLEVVETKDQGIYNEVRKARALIFEFRYNNIANLISRANQVSFNQSKIDSFIKSNPPLLTYDKTIFNQYIELVRSRYLQNNINIADSLLVCGKELIKELKREYHLD
jgi:hypothetical protein